jgi:hypothetical protein
MARETILTNYAQVEAARLIKNRADMWVVLGRQTPWSDEAMPDAPSPATTDIEEPIVAIKANTTSLCREVSSEDYALLDSNLRAVAYADSGYVYLELVPDEDAFTKTAKMIYVEVVYAPFLGMPEADFRIYGIYSGLTPDAGYEGSDWLAPINIDANNYGMLLNISHGIVYLQTDPGRAVTIPMLIEFTDYLPTV